MSISPDVMTRQAESVNPRLRLGRVVNRSNLFQNIAFVFCVLFGIALIANTEPACDGSWFWYDFFFKSGKHLYADMHLALQPLYLLETDAFTTVLGKGWLALRVPAVLHLVAYCLGLLLLVRHTGLSDARKAILFASSFFLSTTFAGQYFGDYYVLADCFMLYSLVALLSLRTSSNVRRTLGLAAILGVLSGLTLTTRLHEGAPLFAGVFLSIACLAPSKRLLSLLLFCLTTGLTLLLVVRLTGDSLHDYVMHSIFTAAGSKGGAGGVLAQPLRLPWNTVEWLRHSGLILIFLSSFTLALIWVRLLRPLTRKRGWWVLGLAVLGVGLVALQAPMEWTAFRDNVLVTSVAGLLILLAYALGIWVVARLIFWWFGPKPANGWDRREILLLIPLAQMASAAMSSGGVPWSNALGTVGVFVVVLAICSPIHLKAELLREALVAFAVLLIFGAATYRFIDPYHWHTYREKPMFADRVWYRHPDYGPMMIDKDLLQMIQPVCQKLRENGSENELLSLPFPFANYFCSVPPWHGYVQTFFDTTPKQTIQSLMDELQSSPPKWIFYQRELTTLRLEEIDFNQGNPLPHLNLDQFIEHKIGEGSWRVVYISDFGTLQQWRYVWDNEWILIQTR